MISVQLSDIGLLFKVKVLANIRTFNTSLPYKSTNVSRLESQVGIGYIG